MLADNDDDDLDETDASSSRSPTEFFGSIGYWPAANVAAYSANVRQISVSYARLWHTTATSAGAAMATSGPSFPTGRAHRLMTVVDLVPSVPKSRRLTVHRVLLDLQRRRKNGSPGPRPAKRGEQSIGTRPGRRLPSGTAAVVGGIDGRHGTATPLFSHQPKLATDAQRRKYTPTLMSGSPLPGSPGSRLDGLLRVSLSLADETALALFSSAPTTTVTVSDLLQLPRRSSDPSPSLSLSLSRSRWLPLSLSLTFDSVSRSLLSYFHFSLII